MENIGLEIFAEIFEIVLFWSS